MHHAVEDHEPSRIHFFPHQCSNNARKLLSAEVQYPPAHTSSADIAVTAERTLFSGYGPVGQIGEPD